MTDTEELVREFTIKNKRGLHARPASLLVKVANEFESDINIGKGEQEVNAKSIMGILILAVACGSAVTVKAAGADSAQAIEAIGDLIERRFDEEE